MAANEEFSFVFQPDLEQVSQLMKGAWARPCWDYDADLLRAHIERPTADPRLNVGQVSDEGKLASFQAYIPFEVIYHGQPLRTVFASFLTVSPEFHGRGLAGPQQGRLIDKAIEQRYDAYLTMCEVGAASNWAVEKIFAKKGLEVKVVNLFGYLAGVRDLIDPILPQQPSGHTRLYEKSDRPAVLGLANRFGREVPLRKIVVEADLDFILADRPYARTYVFQVKGEVRGAINLLLLNVVHPDGTKQLNVYFDNVFFNGLAPDDQQHFVEDVLLDLRAAGYHTAFVPQIGYLPTERFKQLRFRGAPRQINLYLAPLRDGVLAEGIRPVDSFYLDVY